MPLWCEVQNTLENRWVPKRRTLSVHHISSVVFVLFVQIRRSRDVHSLTYRWPIGNTHSLFLSIFFPLSLSFLPKSSFSHLFVSSSSCVSLSLSLSRTGCGRCSRGCQAVTTETFCIIDGVRRFASHQASPKLSQQSTASRAAL